MPHHILYVITLINVSCSDNIDLEHFNPDQNKLSISDTRFIPSTLDYMPYHTTLLLLLSLLCAITVHTTNTNNLDPINNANQLPILAPNMSSPSSAAAAAAAAGPLLKSLNVFQKPLTLHSTSPLTGFLRNGYCEVPPSDGGNHAVAAEVSDAFLDFSAARGNDLRRGAGLTGGCKWCLCVTRWREAFDARGKEGEGVVPRVFLSATNAKALEKVSLDELKMFAVDKEDK